MSTPETETTPARELADWASKKLFRNKPGDRVHGSLLRLHLRGRVIDAQATTSGVVHLAVQANQQDRSMLGRLRQHLANAFFCAGDICHPGYKHRGLRVVAPMVHLKPLDDSLTNRTDADAVEIRALHDADGHAHYNALVLHEGIEHEQTGLCARLKAKLFNQVGIGLRGKEGADDAHGSFVSIKAALNGARVTILPDAARKEGAA